MEDIIYTQSQPKGKPSLSELLPVFEEVLPIHLLRAWIQPSGKRFYERLFTPLILGWGFLFQRLNEDHTCDAAGSHVARGAGDPLDTRHQEPPSRRIKAESTAAYSKGRKRLPLSVLQEALRHTGQVVRPWLGAEGWWFGHPVGLLDGTTLLRPEPALVAHYGRHKSRGKETYWVVMRVVAAFCLGTGALLGVAEGALQLSEQALAAAVLAQAVAGSVYVGDRNFGIFQVAQAARHYNVWTVLRMTRQRARALAGRKLHSGEELRGRWTPRAKDHRPPNMSADPIEGRVRFVRLERNGFRPGELDLFTALPACSLPAAGRQVARGVGPPLCQEHAGDGSAHRQVRRHRTG